MSTLPEKPAAVAHVSDAHWEAALDLVAKNTTSWLTFKEFVAAGPSGYASVSLQRTIGQMSWVAAIAIKAGEVSEPVDPIDAAFDKAWDAICGAGFRRSNFKQICCKHFAGLTFPPAAKGEGV